MSKRAFFILIVVILALLGGLGWYLLYGGATKTQQPTQNGTSQANLFPFGQGSTNANNGKTGSNGKTGGSGTTTIDLSQLGASVPRLRKISSMPTAGAVAFDVGQGTSSQTFIRYIERATGHIFETQSDSNAETEISNVTIPKIHEALWSSDGKNIVLRYLGNDDATVKTFTAKISTSTSEKALSGSFLADNIQDLSVFGSKMFYLNEDMNGAQGVRANIDGSGKTAILSSSFGDWASGWNSSDIIIYPRPSTNASGAAYALNPTTGVMTQVIDGVMGLKASFNSDESFLLYSGANGNALGTAVLDIKKNAKRDIGMPTLVDKCVWSAKIKTVVYCAVPRSPAGGVYPDDWYKGKVSFADSLWKIDVSSGTTQDILDPELEAGISMDIMDLSLDQNEKIILFTNKDDMTVWRLTL